MSVCCSCFVQTVVLKGTPFAERGRVWLVSLLAAKVWLASYRSVNSVAIFPWIILIDKLLLSNAFPLTAAVSETLYMRALSPERAERSRIENTQSLLFPGEIRYVWLT